MKYLFTLLFSLSFIFASAQYKLGYVDTSDKTPKYLLTQTGDTVGVVITYKQAQKIDNDLELLQLYKLTNTDCDSIVNNLNETILSYKQTTSLYDKKIKTLDTMLSINKIELFDVNKQLELCNDKSNLKDSIIKDKDIIIKLDKKDIRKYKIERNVIAITSMAVLIYVLIHFLQ